MFVCLPMFTVGATRMLSANDSVSVMVCPARTSDVLDDVVLDLMTERVMVGALKSVSRFVGWFVG